MKTTSPGRLRLALILGSLATFGPLSMDMYLPALPALESELHAGTSLTQLSLTACLLGLALGQLVAGPISDARGRRGPLLIGVALYFAASLLCAFSPSIGAFIALRFLQGAAGAAGIVIARAVSRDLFSGTELTKFVSLLMLVNGAGPIIAPIIGGQLLKITDWRGIFVALSIAGLIMLVAVLLGLRESNPPDNRAKGGLFGTLATFRRLATDRLFIGNALTQGLVMAAMFAYISGSPFVLQNVYGASPQMFSLMFAVNGLGIIAASQTAGRLAARIGETKLFACGVAISAIGAVLLLAALAARAPLYVVLPPLFLVVSSVGIVSTAGFTLAMQRQGRNAGAASSLLGLMSFLFGGLVAPLVGLGGSQSALPMGLTIAGASLGAAIVHALLVRARTVRTRA